MIGTSEPVAIAQAIKELISAGVKALVIFGLVAWSGEQTAAVMLIVDSALAMLVVLFTRRSVTPIATPTLKPGTEVTIQGSAETIVVPQPAVGP